MHDQIVNGGVLGGTLTQKKFVIFRQNSMSWFTICFVWNVILLGECRANKTRPEVFQIFQARGRYYFGDIRDVWLDISH